MSCVLFICFASLCFGATRVVFLFFFFLFFFPFLVPYLIPPRCVGPIAVTGDEFVGPFFFAIGLGLKIRPLVNGGIVDGEEGGREREEEVAASRLAAILL